MTDVSLNSDVVAGSLMIVLGAGIAGYAAMHYPIGSMRMIGPGAFPLAVGGLLGAIGLAVTWAALKKDADKSAKPAVIEWANLARVALAIAAFAFLIKSLGAVPAIAALVAITMGDGTRAAYVRIVLTTVVLSVASVLLFQQFIGLRFEMIRWPL